MTGRRPQPSDPSAVSADCAAPTSPAAGARDAYVAPSERLTEVVPP